MKKRTVIYAIILLALASQAQAQQPSSHKKNLKQPKQAFSEENPDGCSGYGAIQAVINTQVPEEARVNQPISSSCNKNGTASNSAVSDNKTKPVTPTTGGCENPPQTTSYSGRGD